MNAETGDSRTIFFSGRARSVPCPVAVDERGTLLPLEFDQLPFMPRRLFTVAGSTAGTVRGGHAHRFGQQLLICLQGRIDALMHCENKEAKIALVPGGSGLLLDSGVWCQQTYLDQGTILLVLASEPYNSSSYIDCWN